MEEVIKKEPSDGWSQKSADKELGSNQSMVTFPDLDVLSDGESSNPKSNQSNNAMADGKTKKQLVKLAINVVVYIVYIFALRWPTRFLYFRVE